MSLMAERERIARYFSPLAQAESGSFSLTDDAAVLVPPAGYSMVFTTDSVIETTHLLAGASPQQFAQKLVRRNLSDLAAMGAIPWRYLLNLHTPNRLPDHWFAEFTNTLAAEQATFSMLLIGGDSTSGGQKIHATMSCIGLLNNPPLLRSGAKLGDDLYVSGSIGDAALGLALLQHKMTALHSDDLAFLTARYHLPHPRLGIGTALHSIATSCIDISDGLLTDALQLATASSAGIQLERDAIPLSDAAKSLVESDPTLWKTICTGGDDYELLFTAAPSKRDTIMSLANQLNIPITRIGSVIATGGVRLLDSQNQAIIFGESGWEYQ